MLNLSSNRPVTLFLSLSFGLSTVLAGCSASQTFQTTNTTPSKIISTTLNNSGQSSEEQVIRIGYQKFGTVNLLKARGNLEQRLQKEGITVQWLLFPAGPQLLEALNTGSIDFGHTGEAPPIFAQAAGAPLIYVASQTPNPKAEAILVPKDSPIRTVADLKGKKVVLNKGSNVHFFLVKALEQAGVKYEDIKTVYLPPADARALFEQGGADAWAIWDPFFSAAKQATGARVIKDGEGIVANREFYLAAKPFVQEHPERVQAIIEELQKADLWAKENVTEAATLLSPQLGIPIPVLEEVLSRRPSGVELISPKIIAYQQQIADTFLKLKLLPKPIQVKEAAQVSQ